MNRAKKAKNILSAKFPEMSKSNDLLRAHFSVLSCSSFFKSSILFISSEGWAWILAFMAATALEREPGLGGFAS